jgi:dTDP-4-amino-4,6-dideoxygalactose transaminase
MVSRRHCVVTGNGTTAIFAALSVVRARCGPGEVILPAIACSHVAEAIIYAGFKPVVADVLFPSGVISPISVRERLTEQTRAIIPVHLYGQASPLAEILQIGRDAGVDVLEDAAQAFGGGISGRPFGSFGSFSVLSFGPTKISGAGGGGALVTDDDEVAAMARVLVATLPPLVAGVDEQLLTLSERNLCHSLMDLLRVQPSARVGEAFRALVPQYQSNLLRSLSPDSPIPREIDATLDELPDNLARRARLAARLRDGLSSIGAAVIPCGERNDSGVIWRYSFLVGHPEAAISLVAALRARGILASSHYWSLAQLLYDEKLPTATAFGSRVVNLFVDHRVGDDSIDRAIGVIRETIGDE